MFTQAMYIVIRCGDIATLVIFLLLFTDDFLLHFEQIMKVQIYPVHPTLLSM